MWVMVLFLLLVTALAVVVLGLVAIPARREGRVLLTPYGKEVVRGARLRSEHAVRTSRERAADIIGTTTSKSPS